MTGIPMQCQHCKRPIGGLVTYIGPWPYHYECTRGPGANLNYAPMAPVPGCAPVSYPTEDRVRQIVREELERLELVSERDPR